MEISLLDYIAYRNRCYISDLRYLSAEMLLITLRRIRPEDFSVSDWQDALKYFCDETADKSGAGEIYDRLLKNLEKTT